MCLLYCINIASECISIVSTAFENFFVLFFDNNPVYDNDRGFAKGKWTIFDCTFEKFSTLLVLGGRERKNSMKKRQIAGSTVQKWCWTTKRKRTNAPAHFWGNFYQKNFVRITFLCQISIGTVFFSVIPHPSTISTDNIWLFFQIFSWIFFLTSKLSLITYWFVSALVFMQFFITFANTWTQTVILIQLNNLLSSIFVDFYYFFTLFSSWF